MRKKTCAGFGSVDVMLQVLYKSKEWGRNQLPSDLQDTRNISQRNIFSLYLYTAWPHFSRISWIHKLGSSNLFPDLYRFSLVALSFCGHAVLDWPCSLLCGPSSSFSPFSLFRWPTLWERGPAKPLLLAPAPLRHKPYFLFPVYCTLRTFQQKI